MIYLGPKVNSFTVTFLSSATYHIWNPVGDDFTPVPVGTEGARYSPRRTREQARLGGRRALLCGLTALAPLCTCTHT